MLMRGSHLGRACAALAVALLGCGCGSASEGHSSAGSTSTTSKGHVASLASIIEATQRERTVRFSGTSVLPPDSTGRRLTIDLWGATDLRTNRTEFESSSPGQPGHEDTIFDEGSRVYSRYLLTDPGPHTGTGAPWCWLPAKHSPGPGITGQNTLASLSGSNRRIQYIDQEVVRGVVTTQYRVTGGGKPPLDIWTDAQDRLRRLRWTHGGDQQTDTTDFFNFDAPVTITIPTNAPPCRP